MILSVGIKQESMAPRADRASFCGILMSEIGLWEGWVMATGYFLKLVYQTDHSYPKEYIHFSEGEKAQAQRFAGCRGFLLYETGAGPSPVSRTIFAKGQVASPAVLENRAKDHNDRLFPLAVPMELHFCLSRRCEGVPLDRVRAILGVRNIQRRGGLLELTGEQFETLSRELYVCGQE